MAAGGIAQTIAQARGVQFVFFRQQGRDRPARCTALRIMCQRRHARRSDQKPGRYIAASVAVNSVIGQPPWEQNPKPMLTPTPVVLLTGLSTVRCALSVYEMETNSRISTEFNH